MSGPAREDRPHSCADGRGAPPDAAQARRLRVRGAQMPLDLPFEPRLGREDFLPSPANASALQLVEAWPRWPAHTLLLLGPAGSGKTHLGNIWANLSRAVTRRAADLRMEELPALADAGAVWIDDLGPGAAPERELFHLSNLMRERHGYLLLSSALAPAGWNISLPDLLSRLRAAPTVEIAPPDDALIRAVIVKLMFDRQLDADAGVVEFLAARLERSLSAAREAVAWLDREALARNRRTVTRPIAAEALRLLQGEPE